MNTPQIMSPPLLAAHTEPLSPSIHQSHLSHDQPNYQSNEQSYNQSLEQSIGPSLYRNAAHLSADDLSIHHTNNQSLNQSFNSTSPHIPMVELNETSPSNSQSISSPIEQPVNQTIKQSSSHSDFPTPKKNHLSLPHSASNQSINQSNQPIRKWSSSSNQSINPSPYSSNYQPVKWTGFKAHRHPISLQFSDICLTLNNGQQILSGVTGHFSHSKIHAIMGPSGAGKTSFLNVLAGRSTGHVTGELKINHINQASQSNQSINESINQSIKSISGYVPQDDILHSDLTVYENLYYNAMLRLPHSMPHARKLRIIEDVIEMLGIEKCRNQLVGDVTKRGISGGQRKRVNIGCELVANVTILFMDEPTSGLDASAALEVLSALKNLSQNGLTVITVVHQPRYAIFAQFHSVLLLGTGGRTVFLGPTTSALPYFSQLGFDLPPHENPADFFLDCISGVIRTRRITDDDSPQSLDVQKDKKSVFVTVPPLARAQSIGVPFVDLIPSTTLQRTLSSSQTITSILIDINQSLNQANDPSTDDLQEPIIDFAQAWIDYQTRVGQEKKVRKQSMNQSNEPSINQLNTQSSPESRLRSLSSASDLSDSARTFINQSINNSINQSITETDESDLSVDRSPNRTVNSPFNRFKRFFSPHERKRQRMLAYEKMFHEFTEHLVDQSDHSDQAINPSYINQPSDQYESKESISVNVSIDEDLFSINRSIKQTFNKSIKLMCQREEYDSDDEEWLESYNQSVNQSIDRSVNASNNQSDDAASAQPTDQSPQRKYSSQSFNPYSQPTNHVFGLPKIKSKPPLMTQYFLMTGRLFKKQLRNKGHILVDIFLVLFLAITVGVVYGSDWTLGQYTTQSVFSTLCMGVCACVASLRIFGLDRLVYWRESGVGISEGGYFLSLLTCEVPRTFLYPAIFVGCYMPLARPEANFLGIWGIFCGVYFAMSGLGLLISTLIKPVPALMVGTMTPLVIGGFFNGVNPPVKELSPLMQFLSNFSFTRWAVEGVGMLEAKFVDVYGADNIFWWNQHFGFVDRYATDVGIMVAMGVVLRLLTGVALRRVARSQKIG